MYSENNIKFEDIEDSTLQENEVKIKVMAAGICGSDTHKMTSKWKYKLPAVMGHEFSGYVVEKGSDVTKFEVGDRVIGVPFVPCYKCEYCQKGQFSLCEDYHMIGSHSFGAFAETVHVPESNVLAIGDMDFEEAAMIEPLAVAAHGVLGIKPEIGDTVAVFGMGTIGMLVMEWLKVAGVKEIIAIDIFDDKLEEAISRGATKTINSKNEDLYEKINEYTNDRGVDIALECAGSNITQEQCLLITRKRGKVGYLGIAYKDVLLHEKAFENIFRRELTLKGFWNSYSAPFPGKEWTEGINYINNGKIKVKDLISHRFDLCDTQKAFNLMINREEPYGKVMITPNKE